MLEFYNYEEKNTGFVNGKEWAEHILPGHIVNEDYTVTANGFDLICYNVRVSKLPFNRVWPGYQRDISQSEISTLVQIAGDEEISFEVKAKKPFKGCKIRPLSKGIETKVEDSVIRFTLRENGYYVLELDDYHGALHIFYNPIRRFEGAESATYYFGAGFHFPGTIHIKSNESVYVDKNAYVFGSVFGENVKNVKIFGEGVLDGSFEERIYEHCYENFTKGNIKFYGSENITVDGVILKDSATWCLSLFSCKDVDIKNIKIIGQWRYNTDGIDICNCENVSVKDSFVRSFDDTITLKGIAGYLGNYPIDRPYLKNIHIDGCVLWCGWGRNCEIGAETECDYYDDISFSNCDLIHNSCVAIDIQHWNRAEVRNVTFENLRVELNTKDGSEVYQQSDDQIFAENGNVPTLIRFGTVNHAPIKHITVKNINVFPEEGFPKPIIFINDEKSVFTDIKLSDFYIAGRKAEKEDFAYDISPLDAEEIKLF